MAQHGPPIAPELVDAQARRLAEECYPQVLTALRTAFRHSYSEAMHHRWNEEQRE